jgi:hypothetical protein
MLLFEFKNTNSMTKNTYGKMICFDAWIAKSYKDLAKFCNNEHIGNFIFVLSKSVSSLFQTIKRIMKRIILLCCILFLASCKSKAPSTAEKKEPVVVNKPVEVAMVKKQRAEDLGTRLLETCNVSKFRGFNASEATDKVRKNATKEKIASVCQKINQRNGRFLGINLIDVKYNKKTDEHTFRYAIDYEKKFFKRELFVTINAENKVSAISTKEVQSKPM